MARSTLLEVELNNKVLCDSKTKPRAFILDRFRLLGPQFRELLGEAMQVSAPCTKLESCQVSMRKNTGCDVRMDRTNVACIYFVVGLTMCWLSCNGLDKL